VSLDLSKAWKATFLAPLTSSAALVLSLTIVNPSTGFSLEQFHLLYGFLPLSYPLSFIGICVLGWPWLLALRKIGYLNFYSLSISGFFLGVIVSIIIDGVSRFDWALQCGIVGFIVALTASLIMRKTPNKTRNEMDGSVEPPIR
jgi:hypothetical protein